MKIFKHYLQKAQFRLNSSILDDLVTIILQNLEEIKSIILVKSRKGKECRQKGGGTNINTFYADFITGEAFLQVFFFNLKCLVLIFFI